MQVEVKTFYGSDTLPDDFPETLGDCLRIELSDSIFGLDPRPDLLQRMVRYQLAKAQRGTHKTLGRAEIARTGKKLYKQKGTGGARHGSARAPQFRGGGRSFGPLVRSHAHDLPKKVRRLALKHALSSKMQQGDLIVWENAQITHPKTKTLKEFLGSLEITNALIVEGESFQSNFYLAARNIPNLDLIPACGLNVYDILRRDKLVLTRAAVTHLEARLS